LFDYECRSTKKSRARFSVVAELRRRGLYNLRASPRRSTGLKRSACSDRVTSTSERSSARWRRHQVPRRRRTVRTAGLTDLVSGALSRNMNALATMTCRLATVSLVHCAVPDSTRREWTIDFAKRCRWSGPTNLRTSFGPVRPASVDEKKTSSLRRDICCVLWPRRADLSTRATHDGPAVPSHGTALVENGDATMTVLRIPTKTKSYDAASCRLQRKRDTAHKDSPY